jgi:uncharacterized protein (DUF697 family)/tellurite resistance protein
MMNEELFSGIKVLVALAQADGTIHAHERAAIENAIDGSDLPAGETVAALLESSIDLDAELARITTEDAKRRTFEAASAIVFVDGETTDDERTLLARIAKALGFDTGEDKDRSQRFRRFTSAVPPSTITKVDDPKVRLAATNDEIAQGAAFSGALASSSLPIAGQSAVFTNNVRLARNIGLFYGHDADEAFWRTFVSNIVGAPASWFALRALLDLVPGNGRAAAFATTWALGRATCLYFEEGESIDQEALRRAFDKSKREGQCAAKDAHLAIEARKGKIDAARASLDADLASGKLVESAYADTLVAIA